jgi:hypothetical protein
MNREPTWNESLGFVLVSFAIAAAAAILVVPAMGLGGIPGLIGVVVVVFLFAFFACMLAIDRWVLPR